MMDNDRKTQEMESYQLDNPEKQTEPMKNEEIVAQEEQNRFRRD